MNLGLSPGHGLCIWLTLCSLAVCLAVPPAAQGRDSTSGESGVVEGVLGFELDYDSGNMGLYALSSCLRACAAATPYSNITGFSRSAFKFVYDSTEAYEPLRDLYPIDALSEAAREIGFGECRWDTGKSIDEVKALVKQEIDQGRPLIAPFLKPDAYHGFFIITGYDYVENIFYLQGAFSLDSGYVSMPVPASWDGPTASPGGWASNPIFVLGKGRFAMGRPGVKERKSVRDAIRLYEGGTLEYGTHIGEFAYMAAPGPHTAYYGFPAYDILSQDVSNAPLLVEREGESVVNFGLLWRLDAQLGQLQHDRRHGAAYMKGMATELLTDQRMLLAEIVEDFGNLAEDVAALRKIFWDRVPEDAGTDQIAKYIEEGNSIVFSIPAGEGIVSGLRARGHDTYGTPWGPVVIADSPEKRLRAKLLVKTISSRERNSFNIMQQIVEYIGRLEPDAVKRARQSRPYDKPGGPQDREREESPAVDPDGVEDNE